jgi:hypothetical protein
MDVYGIAGVGLRIPHLARRAPVRLELSFLEIRGGNLLWLWLLR